MASTVTATPKPEFTKEEEELFETIKTMRTKFKNNKSFNRALKKAVTKINEERKKDDEEYAKNNPCDLNKEMSRIAYVYEKTPNGEHNRVIAISMTYTNSGNVSYGASIYKQEGDETFGKQQKKNIRETAEARHKKTPNKFQLDISRMKCDARGRPNFNKIKSRVRKHIGSNGVKGAQVVDTSTAK